MGKGFLDDFRQHGVIEIANPFLGIEIALAVSRTPPSGQFNLELGGLVFRRRDAACEQERSHESRDESKTRSALPFRCSACWERRFDSHSFVDQPNCHNGGLYENLWEYGILRSIMRQRIGENSGYRKILGPGN